MDSYYKEIFDLFNLDVLDNYTLVHENTLSKSLDSDVAYLQDLVNSTGKKALLMYDNNPVWDMEDYFLLLSSQFSDVYLSSANLNNLWSEHPNIVYFPTFYFTQLKHTNYQTYTKEFRFSFLSNKPRFHRIYFYYITKNNISNTDCVSVNNSAFDGQWWKESYVRDMYNAIGKYDKSIEAGLPFATANTLECNIKLNTIGSRTNDHSNKHIAYNSYFNVTGETNITPGRVFLTEKTWKAVRSNVIPIFLESSSTFNALERLSFSFDNIINIKTDDYLSKVNHINQCMGAMSISGAKSFYDTQIPRIEQNVSRFYDTNLAKLFKDHICDKLKI